MKNHALAVLCLAATVAAAQAGHVTEVYRSGPLNAEIPDYKPVLTPFVLGTGGSAIRSLTRVRLTLDLEGDPGGGYAPDLFASLIRSDLAGPLRLDDPSVVLLNRIEGPFDSLRLTFDDVALAGDIHTAPGLGGILEGTFQPDGRLSDSDPARATFLDVFRGLDGVGDWRLNLGDLAPNGTMWLRSWELELTGDDGVVGDIPEASTWLGALGFSVLLAWRWCRTR